MTRSSAELAGEIAETRARISRTLALLDRGYALRFLATRGATLLQEARTGPGGTGEALRRNALPVGLILAGAGWLALVNRESVGSAAALLHGALDRATRFLSRLREATELPGQEPAEPGRALPAAGPTMATPPDAVPPDA